MEDWQIWTERDAREYIAVPSTEDDKYSRGVLGIIAGSSQYPGAAVLTCEGAMQTGVGMVRYFGPRIARRLVLSQRPEVVTQPGQVQAWVIGSGIDSNRIGWRRKALIRQAISQRVPTILDAGALSFLSHANGPTLITPHYRELSALLSSAGVRVDESDVKSDPRKWARFASDLLHVTVLLKGNVTIVASKNSQIELPPAPTWLATAGTGDVLAGILGALVATHANEIIENSDVLSSVAATGSFIHSEAAKIASRGGPITALKLSSSIAQIVSDLSHT